MASKDTGHWVRFFQRIQSATADLGKRANLYLGSGFTVEDLPDQDAIGISLDLSALAQSPWKFYVETRAVANVPDLAAAATIGAVTLTADMRVGLFAQTDQTQNGLYRYAAGVGLVRSSDADVDSEMRAAEVRVRKGDGAGERWRCSNTGSAIPGTDSITWVKVESNGDKAKLDGIESGAQTVTWDRIVTAAGTADVEIDFNGEAIKGIADPTDPQDAVTLAYYEANLPGVTTADDPIRLDGNALDWYPTANVSMNPDGTERGFKDCSGLTGTTVGIASTGAFSLSTAGETRSLTDGSTIVKQWGDAGTRVTLEGESAITTIDDTLTTLLTMALPANITGKVTLHVTATDKSTGDAAAFELLYRFKRHNSGSPSLSAVIETMADTDDVTWDALVALSGTSLVAQVQLDADHLCVGRARWVVDYHTYTLA